MIERNFLKVKEHILKQTELPYPINEVGCAFDTLMEKAQRLSGVILSRKELEMIWKAAIEEGYIGTDKGPYAFACSAPIINLGFSACGSDLKALEVAVFSDGVMTYYDGYEDLKYHRNLEYMQKIKANNPDGTHFRGVDKYGNVTWEPWSSPVECLGIIRTICYYIKGRTY